MYFRCLIFPFVSDDKLAVNLVGVPLIWFSFCLFVSIFWPWWIWESKFYVYLIWNSLSIHVYVNDFIKFRKFSAVIEYFCTLFSPFHLIISVVWMLICGIIPYSSKAVFIFLYSFFPSVLQIASSLFITLLLYFCQLKSTLELSSEFVFVALKLHNFIFILLIFSFFFAMSYFMMIIFFILFRHHVC